jgi:flagellin
MRIQHNITALNAHRNLTSNNSAVTKNLEKLSSGYRINRAGDDAAGLAISEKMRSQITGLQTAQKNAEDGVSLVQTAEGALTEVHSMLNRMVELATQSANGTYSEANRQEMQKEISALRDEIDRISDTANFNGTKLFGGANPTAKMYEATGTLGGKELKGTPQDGTQTTVSTEWTKPTDAAKGSKDAKFTFEITDEEGTTHEFEITVDTTKALTTDQVIAELEKDDTLKTYGITISKTVDKDTQKESITFTSADKGPEAAYVSNVTFSAGKQTDGITDAEGSVGAPTKTEGTYQGTGYDLSAIAEDDVITVNNKEYTGFKDFAELKAALEADGIEVIDEKKDGTTVLFRENLDKKTTNVSLHVGESSDDANTIEVKIKAMSAKSLNLDDINITDVKGAKAAIDTINSAIDTVSSIRSDLGALQNRLEHTINNLGVQNENITAAESRIRDVDMAKEMMAYTKNNILVQSSQAMLAQANQVPQGVLQLLQ